MGGSSIDLLEMLGFVFSLLFVFWPVMLIASLRWKGSLLGSLVVMWSVLAIARVLAMLKDAVLSWSPVPEPLYTILFVAVGAALWTGWGIRRARRQKVLLEIAARAGGETDLLDLSADRFEDLVVELFKVRDQKATRVGGRGDHGVDIRVQTKEGEKWVVQCKRWRKPVGEPTVRDFYGAMQHEGADKGVIVATRGFSGPARRWAKGKPLILCDSELFFKWWEQALKDKNRVGDRQQDEARAAETSDRAFR
jgi:hypothetical protein